jgi:hypothetical protein
MPAPARFISASSLLKAQPFAKPSITSTAVKVPSVV